MTWPDSSFGQGKLGDAPQPLNREQRIPHGLQIVVLALLFAAVVGLVMGWPS